MRANGVPALRLAFQPFKDVKDSSRRRWSTRNKAWGCKCTRSGQHRQAQCDSKGTVGGALSGSEQE